MLDPEIRIPTDEDFVLPPLLESLLDKAKMAYKFLPKQGDIDRLIAKINKKVLRDTNLCVDLRDLKVAYLTSPHFSDICLYLLNAYHSSMLGGHTGITKCYHAISQRFYCPNLAEN